MKVQVESAAISIRADILTTKMGKISLKTGNKVSKSNPKVNPKVNLFLLVRETGLEPVHQRYTPLKRARLPIPPLPRVLYYYT